MTGLIVLLIVSFMIAYIVQREIEEVIPPFVMTLLLGIYGLGILKKSHHAFFLSMCVFGLIALLFAIVLFKRQRVKAGGSVRGTQDGANMQKERPDAMKAYIAKHAGFLVFLAVCLLMLWCYHTHFVLVWDDFHYNATFPKNCYAYGTMPAGFHSATHYKSYLPLLQLFFYWGFQGSTFSEPLMFQYKMVLIYVLILPLFARINEMKKPASIGMGICAAILPFLFMFELQESLSMDTVMGLLFAYAVTQIAFAKERDLFLFYRIAVSLMCLTLIKTIAVIFTAICLGTWVVLYIVRLRQNAKAENEVRENQTPDANEQNGPAAFLMKREWLVIAIVCLLNAIAYASWKVFCARNGNTNYLSNNLMDNLRNGKALPAYAGDTLKNIAKSLFTLSTNLGPHGLTVSGTLVIVILAVIFLRVHKQLTAEDAAVFTMLFLGFLGYLAVLGYTYVFVFEEWEAESLSSLDRYFGTYALMLCYAVLYRLSLLRAVPAYSDYTLLSGEKQNRQHLVFAVLAVALLVTLPHRMLFDALIPSRYMDKHAKMYEERMEVRDEMAPFLAGDYPQGTMLAVNCEGNTIYDRGIDYEVLPHISRPFNVTEFQPEERAEALDERIADMEPDYIYFSARERDYEDISAYELPGNYVALNGVPGMFRKVED